MKAATPMVPSAPGLSSTMTVWRHILPSASAIIRAAASFALPAGNVTIILTGRCGHSDRAEFGRTSTAPAAMANRNENRRTRRIHSDGAEAFGAWGAKVMPARSDQTVMTASSSTFAAGLSSTISRTSVGVIGLDHAYEHVQKIGPFRL